MLSCLLFFGMDGFAELRDAWEVLSAAAQARFFSDWAYWDALLHTFERDPKRFVFAMISDAAPLAIVPLRIEKRSLRGLPLRVLTLPNYHYPSLSEPLCRADAQAVAVQEALLKGLRRQVAWDLLDFDHMMGDSPAAVARPGSVVDPQTTCDRIRGDEPWEVTAARLSPKFRSNLNQSRTRLAKLAAEFGVASEPSQLHAVFERFLQLEDAGWKGANGTSILRAPYALEYYERILRHYGEVGRIRINWLRVGGEYLAMQLCLTEGDTLYVLKIAYDEKQGRLSPGNALLAEVVRSARYRWINLVGSPDWFQAWKPERLPVMRLRMANHTPAGLLALTALKAAKVAKPLLARRGLPEKGPDSAP